MKYAIAIAALRGERIERKELEGDGRESWNAKAYGSISCIS
jgi:hypothetical protein